MSWAFVFLSDLIPPGLLIVLLMLDWVHRDARWRPSLVTLPLSDLRKSQRGSKNS